MLTSISRRRLVVVNCLGLVAALGFPGTGLAMSPQSARSTGQTSVPSTANGDDAKGPGLRLAFFDTVGLPEKVIDKTKLHVEEIFEQIGAVIEWYEPSSVSNGDEPDVPYFLTVILFDKEPVSMAQPADAMGAVIGDDFPPGAVYLFGPSIHRALHDSRRTARPLSSVELGRAYGRVLAHEVVHAFAPGRGHADSGLMAPTQNRHVLTSASTTVDAESVAAFLEGLERLRAIIESARVARDRALQETDSEECRGRRE